MIDAFTDDDDSDWDSAISFGQSGPGMNQMGLPYTPMYGMYPGQYGQQGRQFLTPRQAKQLQLSQVWDGVWQSSTGSLLRIRQGYARLAYSKDVFQDFQIRFKGKELLLKDKKGNIKHYRYQLDDERLILADQSNNLLLFKKVQSYQ